MNKDEIILNNINNCIEQTKIFFKKEKDKCRNINKAINGLCIINNIKSYYYISANDDNTIKKLSGSIFHINLANYFNNFNYWFLFPEKELLLIVPITKLNLITPEYIWNESENMNTPENLTCEVYYPEIKQVINSPFIKILTLSTSSIFIGDSNETINSQINNITNINW